MDLENTVLLNEAAEAPEAGVSDAAFGAGGGAATATVPVRRPRKHKINQEEVWGTSLASIPLIGFLIFGAIPLVLALAMGFLDFSNAYGWSFEGAVWCGFENFIFVLTDKQFWQAVLNTIIFGTATFISLIFSLAIAYLLTRDIKGRGIWRMIYFVPYVCSTIALTLMWKEMFNPSWGIINQMLGNTSLENGAINWTGEPTPFYFMVIIMTVWSGMGYGILLYSAALTNVDQSMVEAATIDGAGSFRIFFRIVLPTISPTTFYLLITGVIGLLQAFATTFTLGSSLTTQSLTIVYYMYNYMMAYDLGVAGAAAWVLAIFILIVTVIQFIGSKRWVKYD